MSQTRFQPETQRAFCQGLVFVLGLGISPALFAQKPFPPPRKEVPVEAFYDVLREWGTFIDTDQYGVAFCPHPDFVGLDFQPYKRGHWVMTEYGWTFTSDMKISWVTDHYGRWVQAGLTNCPWAWIAGSEWGPAWVDFRVGEKVVAWRPKPHMGPRVSFRLTQAQQFPYFELPRLPADDTAFVVVREGEFQAQRLDYVALSGAQREKALGETVPVLDPIAGLHGYEYETLMAQRQALPKPAPGLPKAKVVHSESGEPARRRAFSETVGTLRTGVPGAELPQNKTGEKKPLLGGSPAAKPRNRDTTGSSVGNPGEFSGIKVLDFDKPKRTDQRTVRDLQKTLPNGSAPAASPR